MSSINTVPMHLTDWLVMFGKLIGANQSAERMDSLAEFGAALAEEFSADAFCSASAVAVARVCLGFPTYGRVYEALRAWRAEQRPAVAHVAPPAAPRLALPSPERDDAATWADPNLIEQRVAKLERDPPDYGRRVAARVLWDCIGRNAPRSAHLFRARLNALIWPAKTAEVVEPLVEHLAGPATRRPAPELPIATRIALAEAALTRNPNDGAARMRLDALRRASAPDQGSAA